MPKIPKNNIIAYELLYSIEVGLREFMINTFGKNNQKWWRQRLPLDILIKVKKSRVKERNIKWAELIPHHPLYYIDFPDLRKIIEIKNNWTDTFQIIFGDKDVFCGGLRELEPIRNKIAHSRKISENEVYVLKGKVAIFENAIGKEKWDTLISEQTVELSILEKIVILKDFSESVITKITNFEALENLEIWNSIIWEWWFDSDYLCQDIESLDNLYNVAVEYMKLPRRRGSGHVIENWVKINLSQEILEQTENTFNLLLAQKGT